MLQGNSEHQLAWCLPRRRPVCQRKWRWRGGGFRIRRRRWNDKAGFSWSL